MKNKLTITLAGLILAFITVSGQPILDPVITFEQTPGTIGVGSNFDIAVFLEYDAIPEAELTSVGFDAMAFSPVSEMTGFTPSDSVMNSEDTLIIPRVIKREIPVGLTTCVAT